MEERRENEHKERGKREGEKREEAREKEEGRTQEKESSCLCDSLKTQSGTRACVGPVLGSLGSQRIRN